MNKTLLIGVVIGILIATFIAIVPNTIKSVTGQG